MWSHLPAVISLEINPLFSLSKTRTKKHKPSSIIYLQNYPNFLNNIIGTNASEDGKLACSLYFSAFQASAKKAQGRSFCKPETVFYQGMIFN